MTLLPGLLCLREGRVVLQEVEHILIGFAEHFGSGASNGEVDGFSSDWKSRVDFFEGSFNCYGSCDTDCTRRSQQKSLRAA